MMEEEYLQRNVPGKWSKHEDCLKNDRETSEDIDDDDIDTDNHNAFETSKVTEQSEIRNYSYVPDQVANQILEKRMQKQNTGVKGVLADRKAHKELEQAEGFFKQAYRQQVLTRMVEGSKVDNDVVISNETDDDLFLSEYREKRMKGKIIIFF